MDKNKGKDTEKAKRSSGSELKEWIEAIIIGFIALYIVQNIWRPVLISRFDAHSDETQGATILSIESQAKSLSTMIIAPLLGLSVDFARINNIGAHEFWPIGLLGFIIAIIFFLTSFKR